MVVTSTTNYKGTGVSIDHAQGAIPLTNTGSEYADSQVQSGTCSSTTATGAITHYREGCFFGTVSIAGFNPATDCTSAIIRGLANKLSGNYPSSDTTKTMSIPVGATAVLIACPKGKTGAVDVVNTTVNAPMGSLVGSDNIVATVSVAIRATGRTSPVLLEAEV